MYLRYSFVYCEKHSLYQGIILLCPCGIRVTPANVYVNVATIRATDTRTPYELMHQMRSPYYLVVAFGSGFSN